MRTDSMTSRMGSSSPEAEGAIAARFATILAEDTPQDAKDEPGRAAAEAAGIAWELPEDRSDSAQDIIDGSELLKNLGNQSGVKDMLRERVGDFENDADAAYRAVQVLEHVERFDADGNRIAGNDLGNGEINGFSKGGDAYNGTEAGRLQDFGKYGFENLKGDLGNTAPDGQPTKGDAERDQAERMGIQWERPEGDDRSAEDIIEKSDVLRNLGNQSGVKEMLRDRVGDFETDADAAFRAEQVLDRIVSYDGDGKMLTGDKVFDDRINGFTNSGEARPDTEAGRLQDFGKYGFEVFREESGRFRDFKDANPDADDATTRLYKYADLIGQNFGAIRERTGADGDLLTAEDLRNFRSENPNISDEFKDALDFWSQDGMFEQLDRAKNPLTESRDGDVSEGDLTAWLNEPKDTKDTKDTLDFLSNVANAKIHADVDTSGLGRDVFANPGNYSVEQRAAVLNELLESQALITAGAEGGMWKNDQSKVAIANKVDGHPDPERLLADLNGRISELQSDPEVTAHLKDSRAEAMKEIMEGDPQLADDLRRTYDEAYKSGDALDSLWDAKASDEAIGQSGVLGEFVSNAQSLQETLGIENPEEIAKAVQDSSHYGEIKAYYEDQLVSGDRYASLLEKGDFTSATGAYTSEVALYSSVVDKGTLNANQDALEENFSRIARENILNDSSFDDLKKVFGKDGGDELDVAKVEELLEKVAAENPDLLMGQGAAATTPAQIVTAMRGAWDMMRQGAKLADVHKQFSGDSNLRDAYKSGALHGVSGLFLAGATIANGVATGGQPTDVQIATITAGSIQSAAILGEGGMKKYMQTLSGQEMSLEDILKENPDLMHRMHKLEKGLVGVGNLAAIAGGAASIVTGVNALRNGDEVTAGLTITGGAVTTLAGVAGAVEGGLGVFASAVPRIVASLAGGLGLVAAAVGTVISLIPGLIEEIRQENRVEDFSNVLSGNLLKYGIDGVPYGDQNDIPDSDWPETSDGSS